MVWPTYNGGMSGWNIDPESLVGFILNVNFLMAPRGQMHKTMT